MTCAKDQFIHCGNYHGTIHSTVQQSFLRLPVSTECHEAHVQPFVLMAASPWWFLLKAEVMRSERSSITQVETEVGWWPLSFLFWFSLFVRDSLFAAPMLGNSTQSRTRESK